MEFYPNSRDHRISQVFFNYRTQFWVDEFVIASAEVSCESCMIEHKLF